MSAIHNEKSIMINIRIIIYIYDYNNQLLIRKRKKTAHEFPNDENDKEGKKKKLTRSMFSFFSSSRLPMADN